MTTLLLRANAGSAMLTNMRVPSTWERRVAWCGLVALCGVMCCGLLAGCGPVTPETQVTPPPETVQAEAPEPEPMVPMSSQEMSQRMRMALALNEEAEWQAAHSHLVLLREQQPTNWLVQLEYARSTYRMNGDVELVRAALEQSISLNESNPRAMVMMGQLHEDQGEDGVAEEYYRTGIQLRADDPGPHLALARILRRSSRHEEAIAVLEGVIEHHGSTPRTLILLAGVYEGAGQIDNARKIWERVARDHVDKLQGKTMLYRYLTRTRQAAAANQVAEEITELRKQKTGQRNLRPLRPSMN